MDEGLRSAGKCDLRRLFQSCRRREGLVEGWVLRRWSTSERGRVQSDGANRGSSNSEDTTVMMEMKTMSLLMAVPLFTSSFAKPALVPEPVKVEAGLLHGTVEDGLTIYRGIPFAAPPVGDL